MKELKRFRRLLKENSEQKTLERNLRILDNMPGERNFENANERFLNIIKKHSIKKLLGMGAQGSAYLLDNEMVLKIGDFLEHSWEIIKNIYQRLHNGKAKESDIMIYDYGKIHKDDDSSEFFGYVLMERLDVIAEDENIDRDEEYISHMIIDILKNLYRKMGVEEFLGNKENLKTIVLDYIHKHEYLEFSGDQEQIKILEKWIEFFINMLEEHGTISDLHIGNVGLRKKGKNLPIQFDF
jgi:hypothetical protein